MTFVERTPLTRPRIAAAALALIDEHGLDALSMRKLGGALGVEAMSLYNHVTNKADLLDAVVDALYREVLTAYGEPDGDWMDHARALSHAYVDVAASHPDAVPLLISPGSDAPAARAFDARIVAAARLATHDFRVGALAFATVSNWVIGTIVQQHGLMQNVARDDCASSDTADESVAEFRDAAELLTEEERFDEGLETVLAGLQARYFSG